MEKIPFDAELWKTGKYDVVTRDGDKIDSIIMHEIDVCEPLSVVFKGENDAYHLAKNGKYFPEDNDDHDNDLFLIPKKRKVWIAIGDKVDINNAAPRETTCAYQSKQDLIDNCGEDVIKDWHIIEVELPS